MTERDRVVLPKSRKQGLERGVWSVLWLPGGLRTATVVCPLCGQWGSLAEHTIRADGTVEPSVACPNEEAACTWHAMVTLEGWEPEVVHAQNHAESH